MNIQIFGTKKCQESRKAQRFFKERGIRFQYVNLGEKPLSRGEFNSVRNAVGGAARMIDEGSREYERKHLAHMVFDPEETAFENQALLRTPIVRNAKKATIGYAPETWKAWIG